MTSESLTYIDASERISENRRFTTTRSDFTAVWGTDGYGARTDHKCHSLRFMIVAIHDKCPCQLRVASGTGGLTMSMNHG